MWPTPGLRRASINSFGYGGANAHIVIDDAYNYLHMRGLHGIHNTKKGIHSLKEFSPGPPCAYAPPPQSPCPPEFATSLVDMSKRLNAMSEICDEDATCKDGESHKTASLLVWSAADQGGIRRIYQSYEAYLSGQGSRHLTESENFWGQLAYTLACHRSHLAWRAFSVVSYSSCQTPVALDAQMSSPVRAQVNGPRIGFIFTGQGAQWCAMGMELVGFLSFKKSLFAADAYLKSLGCTWSVLGKSSSKPPPPAAASRLAR